MSEIQSNAYLFEYVCLMLRLDASDVTQILITPEKVTVGTKPVVSAKMKVTITQADSPFAIGQRVTVRSETESATIRQLDHRGPREHYRARVLFDDESMCWVNACDITAITDPEYRPEVDGAGL